MGRNAIEFEIIANIKNIFDSVDKIDKRFKTFGNESAKHVEKISKKINGLSGTLSKAGLAIQGVEAFVRTLRQLTSGIVEFDKQLRFANTLMKKTGDEFKSMERDILNLSKQLPKTAGDLALGLYKVKSMGVEAADSMYILEKAARIASAGGVDTSTAVSTLVKTLEIYNLEAKHAGIVSDWLFKTIEDGDTTFEQLSTQIGRILPLAKSMGVEMGDALSVFSGMTTILGTNEQAATALEATFRTFIQSGDKLKNVGIDINKTLAEDGLIGALQKLEKLTGGDATALKNLGFETESLRGILGLFGGKLEDVAKNFKNVSNLAGSTNRAFSEMIQTAENQGILLTNNLNARLYEYRQAIVSAFIWIVDKVVFTLDNLKQILTVTARAVGTLTTAVLAYKAVAWAQYLFMMKEHIVLAIKNNLIRIQTLWTNRAKIAQKGLNLAMKLNPIGLLVGLLTGLLVAFGSTEGGLSALKDVFMAFWQTIKDVLTNFYSIIKLVFNGITTPFRFAFNVVEQFGKGFADIFSNMGDIMKGFWKILTGDFEAGWDMIQGGVENLGENIKNTIVDAAKETADPVMDAMSDMDFSKSKDAWVTAGKSTSKAFKEGFSLGLKDSEAPKPDDGNFDLPDVSGGSPGEDGSPTSPIDDLTKTLDYMVYIQKMSMEKAREMRMAFLNEQILGIEGTTDKEIQQKIRLMQELERLENEGASKKLALTERIQRTITWITQKNAELREGFDIKERLSTAKSTVMAGINAAVKGVKSAADVKFPGNVIAVPAVLAMIFASLKKAKSIGGSILKMEEGGIVNSPQLALIGEAVHKTGAELVLPERTFAKYMDQNVMPGIMAKINGDMSGVESRLDRVENAIISRPSLSARDIADAVTDSVGDML